MHARRMSTRQRGYGALEHLVLLLHRRLHAREFSGCAFKGAQLAAGPGELPLGSENQARELGGALVGSVRVRSRLRDHRLRAQPSHRRGSTARLDGGTRLES